MASNGDDYDTGIKYLLLPGDEPRISPSTLSFGDNFGDFEQQFAICFTGLTCCVHRFGHERGQLVRIARGPVASDLVEPIGGQDTDRVAILGTTHHAGDMLRAGFGASHGRAACLDQSSSDCFFGCEN